MSHALAGVTFLAFANGAPDIITAVVAGSSSSQSTALIPFGSLYGAALFDMAFILAMVI
jgi:sodium/potassium/calcium exchanger 6